MNDNSKICKHCAMAIPTAANICPHCRKPQGIKLGCAAVILGFVVLVVVISVIEPIIHKNDQPSTGNKSSSGINSPPAVDIPAVKTPTKRLGDIEYDYNYINKKLKKYYAESEDLANLTEDINFMQVWIDHHQAPADPVNKKLYVKFNELLPKMKVLKRVVYASLLESIFMETGMNIDVKATGSNKSILKLTYSLMSKPMVYSFQNKIHINDQARLAGFSKVIYTNNFEGGMAYTTSFKLN